MDTDLGGPGGSFPATRRSVVLATGSPDAEVRERAFETLIAAYWKPVYKYLRLKWRSPREDAEDLTQGFFAQALEKGFLERFDPARARFRTYLRTCLDGFVANQKKAARRLKRGGGARLVPLDFEGAEGELAQHPIPDGLDLEEYFHREWVRSLFGLAVDALRQRLEAAGKGGHFTLFERYDLAADEPAGRPTYAQLGEELGLAPTQVTNHLAAARREFRRLVLEKLAEVTGSDQEYRSEARQLLGVEPP